MFQSNTNSCVERNELGFQIVGECVRFEDLLVEPFVEFEMDSSYLFKVVTFKADIIQRVDRVCGTFESSGMFIIPSIFPCLGFHSSFFNCFQHHWIIGVKAHGFKVSSKERPNFLRLVCPHYQFIESLIDKET